MICVKFGGTSLADAAQFKKVRDIIQSDPRRKFVVVSAPGKRFSGDIKITDMLEEVWKRALRGGRIDLAMKPVTERFSEIAYKLKLEFDADKEAEKIVSALSVSPDRDYCMSRGEYLSGKLMSLYLDRPFVDPARHVFFDRDGSLDSKKTLKSLGRALSGLDGAVIPGFYGSTPSGGIKTFSRGGSDITGALVAAAVGAELYENWTDVNGLLAADPRVVNKPETVRNLSYRELRILSYMGASVMHADAARPVREAGIPIRILNTNCPEDEGTLIVPVSRLSADRQAVTGVAGRKGLSVVQVEKQFVSDGAGFMATLLELFKARRLPFEQCLNGIDTISIVIRSDLLKPRKREILGDIRRVLAPDILNVTEGLSMITVVGENVPESENMTVKLLAAVGAQGITISTINQGAGRLNLILGVHDDDYEKAIKAIYQTIRA